MISMKIFFGLSYLSIPNIFKLAGIIGGSIGLTFVVIINYITMLQCLMVASKFPDVKSYSDLGFRVLGFKGKIFVDITICITQVTSCVAY